MTECVEVLETSPDAAPTDKYLCHLVWTHRMGEEIGIQFSMDDPATTVNILDARTQYALRVLERDLDRYRDSVPKEMMQRKHLHTLYTFTVYTSPWLTSCFHPCSDAQNQLPPAQPLHA